MRTFLAIGLDDALRHELSALREAVIEAEPRWAGEKWVSAQNLHLTLRFLGERDPDDVSLLVDALTGPLSSLDPFAAACAIPVEPVPRGRRYRMLWSRFEDPGGSFAGLATGVDAALCTLGIPPEQRPFVPHVTLCRTRRPQPYSPSFPLVTNVRSSMSVREVMVFSSELRRSGPEYTSHAIIPLAQR